MNAQNTATIGSPWISSPGYDLSFVMGGALLTLMVPLIAGMNAAWVPILFWTWLIFFEGSHFWATFSRTYIDSAFRKKNPGVLSGSLVFFLFPVLAVLLDRGRAQPLFIDFYGFFVFSWSLFHNARQHYGFVSIYNKKSGNSIESQNQYRKLIYFAVGAAQVHFVLNHRLRLTFSGFPTPAGMSVGLAALIHWGPILVSVITGSLLVNAARKSFQFGGAKSLVPFTYSMICLIFYSVMFYVVAPMEPFFGAHMNNAQLFMVIAIMNSLFHNIQYHAIVFHYGRKRYVAESSTPVDSAQYGVARWVNSGASRYLGVALFFGATFGAIVWFGGDWPSISGAYAAGPFNPLMYVLYFGIVGHHFYLDQKIWRPSQQSELRSYLGLSSSMNAVAS